MYDRPDSEDARHQAEGPIRVAVVGVGGHGVVMCSRLVAETAVSMGITVSMSEVHGMAQRGGVVETTLVMGDGDCAMIGRGGADLLLATEPLEALRARHLARPGGSFVVWMEPNPPATPYPRAGGPSYPGRDSILAGLLEDGHRLWTLDPAEGVRANAALLGAAVCSGVLPFDFDDIAGTVRRMFHRSKWSANLESMEYGRESSEHVTGKGV